MLSIISFGAFSDEKSYPKAVISYLDQEFPIMEVAIANSDMTYFENANVKMGGFLKRWGLDSNRETVIDLYPECTNAITDYQIVGLCQILPSGSICELETFFPKFERNLSDCKEIAGKG